jgi:hypothetical protein
MWEHIHIRPHVHFDTSRGWDLQILFPILPLVPPKTIVWKAINCSNYISSSFGLILKE